MGAKESVHPQGAAAVIPLQRIYPRTYVPNPFAWRVFCVPCTSLSDMASILPADTRSKLPLVSRLPVGRAGRGAGDDAVRWPGRLYRGDVERRRAILRAEPALAPL